MPGFRYRPEVAATRLQRMTHKIVGGRIERIFTSCQESTSLSQEQCKTCGAHIGDSSLDLKVNLVEHSAQFCHLKLVIFTHKEGIKF